MEQGMLCSSQLVTGTQLSHVKRTSWLSSVHYNVMYISLNIIFKSIFAQPKQVHIIIWFVVMVHKLPVSFLTVHVIISFIRVISYEAVTKLEESRVELPQLCFYFCCVSHGCKRLQIIVCSLSAKTYKESMIIIKNTSAMGLKNRLALFFRGQ